MAQKVLAGGQGDGAVDPKAMAISADHDLGVPAAAKVFADALQNFVGDPRSQGLANSDMFAGYLDLHRSTRNL